MGILSIVEGRPTPKPVYNLRVHFLVAVALSISCMIGYDSAFIGTTLAFPSFKDEFEFGMMSTTHRNFISANIVFCYQAGAFFESFFAYPIVYFWGRKVGLLFSAVVFIVGTGLMLGVVKYDVLCVACLVMWPTLQSPSGTGDMRLMNKS